jgi:tetratricopeptide (TPR) repeat protein
MSTNNEPPERRMLPRWRSSQTSFITRENSIQNQKKVSNESQLPAQEAALNERLADWQTHRNLGTALDLVGTALIIGVPEVAKDAALLILGEEANTTAEAFENARRILEPKLVSDGQDELGFSPPALNLKKEIRDLRNRVRAYQHNPIAWSDLARAFASLGQREKAKRAMKIAVGLAPNHRFILRAASRLLLHTKDTGESLHLLQTNAATPHDPWLIAAEISTAMVAKKPPRFVREAQRLIKADQFSAFHIAELSAALGTLELASGGMKEARRLYVRSLREPTENVVAQARWATRKFAVPIFEEKYLSIPRTFEARAWASYHSDKPEQALLEFRNWLSDEPYSSRPVIPAAFLSHVLSGEFNQSIELTQMGLAAEPENPMMLNNLAFFAASADRLDLAEPAINKATKIDNTEDEFKICLLATRGLIAYRKGQLEEGKAGYLAAIQLAQQKKNLVFEAMAMLYLAREEYLAESLTADESFRIADELTNRIQAPDLKLIRKQIAAVRAQPRNNQTSGEGTDNLTEAP